MIVDEASMLSLEIARHLVAAIGPRTHLVLIGDADQLPPVGGLLKKLYLARETGRALTYELASLLRPGMTEDDAHRIYKELSKRQVQWPNRVLPDVSRARHNRPQLFHRAYRIKLLYTHQWCQDLDRYRVLKHDKAS